MSFSDNYCILIQHYTGKKEKNGLGRLLNFGPANVTILPGTLLVVVATEQQTTSSRFNYVLKTLDSDCIQIICSSDNFMDISKDEYELLLTIPTCQERLTVFLNRDWLIEGLTMTEGDHVDVYVKGQAQNLPGVIRYKGPVDLSNGIHFGIELVRHPGKGESDGMFRQNRYFKCAPDSAVFVGLHHVRKSQSQGKSSWKSDENKLPIGSRVVWLSDEGPESGVVKWVGCLSDALRNDDITVGVEFDNPVGTGTGKYKDTRLFTAKKDHASLIPLIGLMLEKDFYQDAMPPSAHPGADNVQKS